MSHLDPQRPPTPNLDLGQAGDWVHLSAEQLNEYRGALAETMGIFFTHASSGHLVATMPVSGNTQPYGLLHGGASVVLAETVGSVLSALVAGPQRQAVGMTVNAIHHRPVASGHVTANGQVITAGRSTVTTQIVISDEHDRRVCTATLICALRESEPR